MEIKFTRADSYTRKVENEFEFQDPRDRGRGGRERVRQPGQPRLPQPRPDDLGSRHDLFPIPNNIYTLKKISLQ